jgi:thymidine phosphorylase
MGKQMTALITNMDQPLGCAAGNALEIVETCEALHGRGPVDLMEVTLALAERMLLLAGVAQSTTEAGAMLAKQIESGTAWETFLEMVRLHGGNVATLEDTSRLPRAKIQEPFLAPQTGYVAQADAELIGKACIVLGAGRTKTTDAVDHAVGISQIVKIGAHVERGQPLAVIHANDPARLSEARKLIAQAFQCSENPVSAPPLILEEIRQD